MPVTRTSARANKGQHSKRLVDNVYDYELPDTAFSKRRKRADDEVRCSPCGTTAENYNEENDEGGTFILCEGCRTWQHARCMGYDSESIPDKYMCTDCKNNFDMVFKTEPVRAQTAKAFFVFFERCFPKDHKFAAPATASTTAREWAFEMEDIIHREFPKTRYSAESRRILFLLKKNFMPDVIAGTLLLAEVVKKTPEEINQTIKAVKAKLKDDLKHHVLAPLQHEALRQQEREKEAKEAEGSISVARLVDHRRFSGSEEDLRPQIRPALPLLNPTFFNPDDDEPEHQSDLLSSLLLDLVTTPLTVATEIEIVAPAAAPEAKGPLWQGTITFPDFASFPSTGNYYASTASPAHATKIVGNLMAQLHYMVEGRLDRQRADQYLDAITKLRDLWFVRLNGTGPDFDKLYHYLLYRNKVGVLSHRPAFVKDSYLMAIDFRDDTQPAYVRRHKQGDDIGLFAVYVVQRNYQPSSVDELLSLL